MKMCGSFFVYINHRFIFKNVDLRYSIQGQQNRAKEREDKDMSRLVGPTIEVESAHGVREVSLDTRHLMNRRIFIHGEIDDDSANDFLSQMLYLEQESDEPITIYINSPGGQVDAGLLIYDCIQSCDVEVNIVCAGMAASMAAILLASGKKGHRYILPHSKVMIHEPLISQGVGGSATSIKNISDTILAMRELVNNILAKHTGKTLEEVNKATAFDNYMNAEAAIEFGICDQVAEKVKLAF